MAYEVLWTESAERDRNRILEYLLYDLSSPQAAAHFMDELDNVLDLIGTNPYLFALSREPRLQHLGYRVCHVMNYLLLYRVASDNVYIGRIFHQTQDYARLV